MLYLVSVGTEIRALLEQGGRPDATKRLLTGECLIWKTNNSHLSDSVK